MKRRLPRGIGAVILEADLAVDDDDAELGSESSFEEPAVAEDEYRDPESALPSSRRLIPPCQLVDQFPSFFITTYYFLAIAISPVLVMRAPNLGHPMLTRRTNSRT